MTRSASSSSTAPGAASRSAATSRTSARSAASPTAAPTCARRSAAYKVVEALPKPTIAAVHGHALGGGAELTLVCDIVIADETARFGTPEAARRARPRPRRGARPEPGEPALDEVHGHDRPAARRAGGLDRRPGEQGRARGRARRRRRSSSPSTIATRSPLALAVGKEILNRDSWDGYQYAVEAISLLQSADDFKEGIAAFTDRRAPVFAMSDDFWLADDVLPLGQLLLRSARRYARQGGARLPGHAPHLPRAGRRRAGASARSLLGARRAGRRPRRRPDDQPPGPRRERLRRVAGRRRRGPDQRALPHDRAALRSSTTPTSSCCSRTTPPTPTSTSPR